MKSIKRISKDKVVEILLLALIAACFYVYFVVYLTNSREAWYHEMFKQLKIVVNALTGIGG